MELTEVDNRVETGKDVVIVSDRHHRGTGSLHVVNEDVENVLLVGRIEIARWFVAQQQWWLR